MTSIVETVSDWNNISPPNSGLQYMKLTPGNHKVRLIGKDSTVKFYTKWINFKNVEGEFKNIKVVCKPEHPNARQTYATVIFDRADTARGFIQYKILEGGRMIFVPISKWAEAFGKSPGSKEAPDFLIEIEIPGGNKRAKKYNVMHLKETTFNSEEIAYIKNNELPKLVDEVNRRFERDWKQYSKYIVSESADADFTENTISSENPSELLDSLDSTNSSDKDPIENSVDIDEMEDIVNSSSSSSDDDLPF